MQKTYFIKTFGCQQNEADSERLAGVFASRGMIKAENISTASQVVINTCMIREMAENRVYGTVYNLSKQKEKTGKPEKIIVTGCMVGMAARDKTGKFLKLLRKRMPTVDEFLPIEEVGFDFAPLRTNSQAAWVPIANGCNNFCTFCVVPFTRGREISRPYKDIVEECFALAQNGYRKITLLGMNVNSYGADLIAGEENVQVLRDIDKKYFDNNVIMKQYNNEAIEGYKLPNGNIVEPVLVRHLNRLRIPTLFPYLLSDICKIGGIEEIDFMSSNPWDFSDELIDVIRKNKKITRKIHFALQSGSNTVLKRMNRWYTREQYLALLSRMRARIPGIQFSTDIIVGFCGETDEEFEKTRDLAKQAQFYKAYIAMYSDRPLTAAHKAFLDDVPHVVKKKRWQILEDLINKPNLKKRSTHSTHNVH